MAQQLLLQVPRQHGAKAARGSSMLERGGQGASQPGLSQAMELPRTWSAASSHIHATSLASDFQLDSDLGDMLIGSCVRS